MKNIDSDLIRGNIDTIILTTMLDGDKYGLDIIKEVEVRSNGTYDLKQPTLYSCLKRLENQELISSYWLDSDIGGRRHYYKLTEKGKESLLQKQEEWTKSKFIIDNLLSNHDYDEYRLVKKEDYERIIEGKQFEYKPEQQSPISNSKFEPEEINETEELDEDNDSTEEFESAENTEFEEVVETKDSVEEDFAEEENWNQDSIDETDFSDDSNEYKFNENATTTEKRIDYNDDDSAEADYPNQKRFKIPSIYDKITIGENDSFESDDTDEDDETEYTSSIYSSFVSEETAEDEEEPEVIEDETDDFDKDIFGINLNEDEIDEITDEYTSLLEEEMLGENEDDAEERVYVQRYNEKSYEDDDADLDIPTNTLTNQSANEMNILSRLRSQEDDEINEYYGDKNSYINHLNKTEEIETLKSDDLNVVQENLLSSDNYLSQNSINRQINDLSEAVKNLNSFGTEEHDYYEEKTAHESAIISAKSNEIEEELDSEIEDELITNIATQEESKDIIDFNQETNTDDYLDELAELKSNNNNGYFNSFDSADYSTTKPEYSPIETDESLSFSTENSVSFNEQIESYNNQYGYNNSNEKTSSFYDNDDEESFVSTEENTAFSSFDDIISKNVNTYSNDTTDYIASNQEFKTFTPRFTENNYKQKLNNLSAYSKYSQDEHEDEITECAQKEDVMNKVKDIKTLKTEFASDGILVKEYKKSNVHAEDADRNYLLSNKLNLIKSLILLFGYVFLLSAVFIIMNNTSAQTIHNFSFKYFLIAFIPFIVYAIYHVVMFVINPYKKVPAKYAPRIMIFIAVIITIQLLLITYCLNLQMGFYSFSQSHYNHLLWVIPTIVSFAPIISTLIHMALYYSRNFNV